MALLWLLWACTCSQTPVEVAPEPPPVVEPAPAVQKPTSEVQISGDLTLRTTDLAVKCSPQGVYLFGREWSVRAEGIDGPVEVAHAGRTFRSETGAKRMPQGYKFSTELDEVDGSGSIRATVLVDCSSVKQGTKPRR